MALEAQIADIKAQEAEISAKLKSVPLYNSYRHSPMHVHFVPHHFTFLFVVGCLLPRGKNRISLMTCGEPHHLDIVFLHVYIFLKRFKILFIFPSPYIHHQPIADPPTPPRPQSKPTSASSTHIMKAEILQPASWGS